MEDPIDKALLPNGEPTDASKGQFFELYKLMVASSEALVSRRQAANTYFLAINGALLTAIGLFLRGTGKATLKAAAISIVALAGITIAYVWRSLLISFGQLNTGKFAIIERMERRLAASIYRGEWEALGGGKDRKIYRTFTSRETIVPTLTMLIYLLVMVVSALVAFKVWKIH